MPSHYPGAVSIDDGELRFVLNRLVSYEDASLLAERQRVSELVPGPTLSRAASTEEMVKELRRIPEDVGRRTITSIDVLTHSQLMSERAVINRFGSWKTALEAAGLQLSKMGRCHSEDDYFVNLLAVRPTGHHPTPPRPSRNWKINVTSPSVSATRFSSETASAA